MCQGRQIAQKSTRGVGATHRTSAPEQLQGLAQMLETEVAAAADHGGSLAR